MFSQDVQPGNVLITCNASVDVVPEHEDSEVQIGDACYPVLPPQPLTHGWEWNDQRDKAELYEVKLADLGHGEYAFRSSRQL